MATSAKSPISMISSRLSRSTMAGFFLKMYTCYENLAWNHCFAMDLNKIQNNAYKQLFNDL